MSGVPECQVWWRTVREIRDADVAVLSDLERDRVRALRRPADQARSAAAAALLRRRVAAWAGIGVRDVTVDRSCATCARPHGKPLLPGLNLHVSISHSGERVGVALTEVGPVGLDVEQVGTIDIVAMAGQVLGGGEVADDRPAFYRYWTRKESVVKATGDGIGAGLRRVRVSGPAEEPRLLSYPDRPDLLAVMRDLRPGDGYVAAVTILTAGRSPAPAEVTVREYAE